MERMLLNCIALANKQYCNWVWNSVATLPAVLNQTSLSLSLVFLSWRHRHGERRESSLGAEREHK
jgi:hypothetical protein